jgi:hypothetical protein
MKSLEERITEVMNIRLQLQSLGLLSVPIIQEQLKRYTNTFVKEALPQTFLLKESGYHVKVQLSINPQRKSGITLLTN